MSGIKGMHERTSTSPTYEAILRDRIKAPQLLNRLQDHALGECEMTSTQIQAAQICLRKVLADKTETKSEVTVRKIESMHEEQARLLAETFIESQRLATAGAASPDSVHGGVSSGLPAR